MSDTNPTDKSMLEAIRRGDAEAWGRLIDEYQGRLLRFAQSRVSQHADAEDIVQEAFTSFLKAVDKLKIEVSLETYLFGILRNEIANRFRGRAAKTVCLIQDIYRTGVNPLSSGSDHGAGASPSVSWCVCQNELQQLQRQTLAKALQHLVAGFKNGAKLRDLKIAELLFYCNLRNTDVAKLLDLDDGLVRVIKHRCLKRIRASVLDLGLPKDASFSYTEDILTELWESMRLSCPKRSTLAAFLLETIPPEWFDYVDFHLTTVGCHFCRASFKDLQEQQSSQAQEDLRQRIMTTTIGFFAKP